MTPVISWPLPLLRALTGDDFLLLDRESRFCLRDPFLPLPIISNVNEEHDTRRRKGISARSRVVISSECFCFDVVSCPTIFESEQLFQEY